MHIERGDSSLSAKQSLIAMSHFYKAIAEADVLLTSFKKPVEAVTAVVISHHRLADVFVANQAHSMAKTELQRVHNKLSTLLNEGTHNGPFKDALLFGLSQCYFALREHVSLNSKTGYSNHTFTGVPFGKKCSTTP